MLDFELIKRFVSDEKLPIQVIKDENYFNYILDLLEDTFGSRTKWNGWLDIIESHYSGDSKKYLADFYKIRESIIVDMKANEAYQEFNTGDMNKYRIIDMPPQLGSYEIYRPGNHGKYYLSLDLKKANFQALRFAKVIKEDTYEDWLKNWTDLPHLLKSKYLRVVVFGQLNPGRHITVEKYITSEIYKQIEQSKILENIAKPVSFRNDELIWEVPNEEVKTMAELLNQGHLSKLIAESGFSVSLDFFKLRGFEFIQDVTQNKVNFYKKEHDCENIVDTYHCIPGTYQAIITKLLSKKDLVDYDTWFMHDGMLSKFIGNFKIEEVI